MEYLQNLFVLLPGVTLVSSRSMFPRVLPQTQQRQFIRFNHLNDPRIMMKNNNDIKVRSNNKEVIITVYVESDSLLHHPFKKINPHRISRKPHQTATTHFYDRRACLLAYAHELRKNANSQQLQWAKNGSKPKHKVSFISSMTRYITIMFSFDADHS